MEVWNTKVEMREAAVEEDEEEVEVQAVNTWAAVRLSVI